MGNGCAPLGLARRGAGLGQPRSEERTWAGRESVWAAPSRPSRGRRPRLRGCCPALRALENSSSRGDPSGQLLSSHRRSARLGPTGGGSAAGVGRAILPRSLAEGCRELGRRNTPTRSCCKLSCRRSNKQPIGCSFVFGKQSHVVS